MKEKRLTTLDFISMPRNEFLTLHIILRLKAFRLLGVGYKKFIRVYWDTPTGDLVIQYE